MQGMGSLSPSNILQYFKGINFPVDKQELIDFAEDHDAPDQIINVLQGLPDQVYNSANELMQHIAQLV